MRLVSDLFNLGTILRGHDRGMCAFFELKPATRLNVIQYLDSDRMYYHS